VAIGSCSCCGAVCSRRGSHFSRSGDTTSNSNRSSSNSIILVVIIVGVVLVGCMKSSSIQVVSGVVIEVEIVSEVVDMLVVVVPLFPRSSGPPLPSPPKCIRDHHFVWTPHYFGCVM
jgi:hypothetical protein